jgi:hypothetical protein
VQGVCQLPPIGVTPWQNRASAHVSSCSSACSSSQAIQQHCGAIVCCGILLWQHTDLQLTLPQQRLGHCC